VSFRLIPDNKTLKNAAKNNNIAQQRSERTEIMITVAVL